MAPRGRSERISSMASDSSSASSPERGALDDDYESIMEQQNDSQSSLSVSLEDMDLDAADIEHQHRVSPISRLPAELLISVFSKLPTPQDVQNCMLVSKTWARNAVDLLWHRPSTNQWKSLLSVIETARKRDGFFAYHDLIKRLNLGQLKHEISDGTLLPLQVCKRIERLTLPGCSQLTDMSIVPIIQDNRSLMAIDVSDLELITDKSMLEVAKNCYKLQGLNVSNCKGLTDESMVEVARNCRRIKRLKLNDCSQLTDVSVLAFADHCHDVLEIDLYKCSHITDISVTALLTKARQLRELRLAQCFRVTDEAFLKLPSEQHFDALRILDLTDCNELQDSGLEKIVRAAPRLRNLVLAKCRNITDRGVFAITRLGKNLHFLHLGHCANITDYGVSHLVKYCNRIRYIDFSCCGNLTDDSISLLANLPKLKRIGLVKCTQITDYSIRALAQPKPLGVDRSWVKTNLERLHLSYCTNLTIPGIRYLLLNCPHLTHLSLTGVHPFLREDVLRFCRDAPQEFNDHQRDVFCVFSGGGVDNLRAFLQEGFPTPPTSDIVDEDEHMGQNVESAEMPQTTPERVAEARNAPVEQARWPPLTGYAPGTDNWRLPWLPPSAPTPPAHLSFQWQTGQPSHNLLANSLSHAHMMQQGPNIPWNNSNPAAMPRAGSAITQQPAGPRSLPASFQHASWLQENGAAQLDRPAPLQEPNASNNFNAQTYQSHLSGGPARYQSPIPPPPPPPPLPQIPPQNRVPNPESTPPIPVVLPPTPNPSQHYHGPFAFSLPSQNWSEDPPNNPHHP